MIAYSILCNLVTTTKCHFSDIYIITIYLCMTQLLQSVNRLGRCGWGRGRCFQVEANDYFFS